MRVAVGIVIGAGASVLITAYWRTVACWALSRGDC